MLLNQSYKGWTNQKPTCLKDNPEKDLVPMRCRAYPGLPSKSCLQGTKAFELERIGHNFITLTISLWRNFEHRKTFYSEVLAGKICELNYKTPSLTLGKVTIYQDIFIKDSNSVREKWAKRVDGDMVDISHLISISLSFSITLSIWITKYIKIYL